MGKCDICGEKTRFLTEIKCTDGLLCGNCRDKITAYFKEKQPDLFDDYAIWYIQKHTVSECKLIVEGEITEEIEEYFNWAKEDQDKQIKEFRNKNYCAWCGEKIKKISYPTSDERRFCPDCAKRVYSIEVIGLSTKDMASYIAKHDFEFFYNRMRNVKRLEHGKKVTLLINYTTRTVYDVYLSEFMRSKKKGFFSFDDIVKIENGVDTYEVMKGSSGHPVLRAIAGGAVFGVAGAVVGAMTANNTKHYVQQQGNKTLTIYYKDSDGRYVSSKYFFDDDNSYIRVESWLKEIFQDDEDKENQQKTIPDGSNVSANKKETETLNDDIFIQLKKYKELLDEGILTQEEFDNQKKALLEKSSR